MSRTKAEVMRDHDHVEMMKNPDWWSRWPFLPLKRYKGNVLECAFLGEFHEVPKFRVFRGNIFAPEFANFTDYESAEDIAADGWEVD